MEYSNNFLQIIYLDLGVQSVKDQKGKNLLLNI